MPLSKILLVDDDVPFTADLAALLTEQGYQVHEARSAEEALDTLRGQTFHLMLCALRLPGQGGLSLLRTVRTSCPDTACVLLDGQGCIRSAVTALKRGAVEYLTKPIQRRRLLGLCRALVAASPAYLSNQLLECSETVTWDGLHARSLAMRAVFERIGRAAELDTPVLLLGESGTGKEMVARSIHQRSPRDKGPFLVLETGVLPPKQIASELFGQETSRKTGGRHPGQIEGAQGGTLFLDEISTLDDYTQLKLLRMLESSRYERVGGRLERRADLRLIAASSCDLEARVRGGQFRADLLYRLHIIPIQLPSLRQRPEDIPVLASALVQVFCTKYGRPLLSLPAETQRLLLDYPWPGNVRELCCVIEHAVLLARGAELDPRLLPHLLYRESPLPLEFCIPIGTRMAEIEREVLLRTLEAHHGNKTAAAAALGISRRSLYNKLAEIAAVGVSIEDDPIDEPLHAEGELPGISP